MKRQSRTYLQYKNKIIELYNAFLTRNLRDYSIKTLKRGRELLKNEKLFSLELTNIYTQLAVDRSDY